MSDTLRRQWHDLLATWAVDPVAAERTFADICRRYAESGRFYHTIAHIDDVLATVESLVSYAAGANAVRLAAWLHDVVYDTRSSDNEERSAEYAERMCSELWIPAGARVASLILKTKTHAADPDDVDSQILVDADLAILGADEPDYLAYAEAVRREYVWVSDPNYRRGRREVLQNFLARPRIYQRLQLLEEPARRNLAAEVAQLSSP